MEFITNIQIGSNGRLGNQIFQYVILLILNKLYKISIRIPVIKTCDAYKNFRLNEIFDKLNYQILDKIPNNIPSYCEKTELYDNNIYKLGNVNVRYLNIKGYFQSYKYLTGYEEYIKKNLVIKPSLIEFGKNYLKKIKEKHKILVGLHIRLGDYLNEFNKKIRINLGNNKFLKLFKNYFEKKFGSNIGFVLISDNINLCKKNLIKWNNLYYVENTTDLQDFVIYGLTDHQVISVSTFSWWSAYLFQTKSKIIFIPSHWYKKKDSGLIDRFYNKKYNKLNLELNFNGTLKYDPESFIII